MKNIKNVPMYICSPEDGNSINITNMRTIAEHETGDSNGRLIICPNIINSETINPNNFMTLSEKFKIDELLLLDRINGTDGVIAISDHVNISGYNFLRANTPHKDLPQFPDMSKIYNRVEGYKKTVVHTVGPLRFKNQQTSNNIVFSELVGLIAPVAHYVGIKVFALGCEKTQLIMNLL